MREAIWQVVAQIPEGRVATYGQVARLAGYPGYARQVGAVLKKLPADSKLPWHRVINAQGRVSFTENSQPYLRQRKRLEAEEVVFAPSGKIPLKKFSWNPEFN